MTTLELTYRKPSRQPEVRLVTPKALRTARRGNSYLVAYDHARGEVRSFRVDRIESYRQVETIEATS